MLTDPPGSRTVGRAGAGVWRGGRDVSLGRGPGRGEAPVGVDVLPGRPAGEDVADGADVDGAGAPDELDGGVEDGLGVGLGAGVLGVGLGAGVLGAGRRTGAAGGGSGGPGRLARAWLASASSTGTIRQAPSRASRRSITGTSVQERDEATMKRR
ncbi:hypothetical protein GCM10025872_03210 [Barrientosiimonas endolithica]|uniref:Uncharacterized protein n=1 Tax=Barrientosiimonas endolithica TaxID=1535208 RepID=A0ABM8H741_9MICO|nr:hypothetical protein GCM10025872_03210 [Barrientosiimonas endolithica]